MMNRAFSVGQTLVLMGLITGALESWAVGQREKLSRDDRTNGKNTISAIGDLEPIVAERTVSILDGEEVVALGTIWGDGWLVLTKASELGWQTAVRFSDHRLVPPTAVAVDEANDLAILTMPERFDLGKIHKDQTQHSRGTILLAPADSRRRIRMGIIGADSRGIERVGGALGVGLGQEGIALGGVQVARVYEETAAERAGVQGGDIIRSVNGKVVLLREQLIEEIGSFHPGEPVLLEILRGEQQLNLEVVLGFRSTYFGQMIRNQRLSGKTSTRLTGFESVIQHDVPVDVDAMGGGLFNLRGALVGVNIARSDRVATFALPVALIESILEKLGFDYGD